MGVESKHPLYSEHVTEWMQMRDTYRGERVVKRNGRIYLPATAGMIADGINDVHQLGYQNYLAYLQRARFPDLVRYAVEALLGIMHRRPPTIELPASMEFLRDRASRRNESLDLLLRRINEEQLITGRVGVLCDVVDDRPDQLYFATYCAETMINWDEGRSDGIEVQNLNFVSLDETSFERVRDFEWEEKQKYRVLLLTDPNNPGLPGNVPDITVSGDTEPVLNLPEGVGTYMFGIFREEQATFNPSLLMTPSIRGNVLTKIPFVFINTKDIVPEPDEPPLLGLSNLNLAIYRGEADYRQSLYMQGQDTLVIIGSKLDADGTKQQTRVGAGATIELTQGSDAKYIGVDSSGLPEMRESLENDYDRAARQSGQLLDTTGGAKESGEALRVRVAAKTATLNQIALSGAAGLQYILRIAAEWLGADPQQVVVEPNLDFTDDQIAAQEVVQLMTAKQLRAPVSLRSIHATLLDRGLATMSFEDEIAEIEKETNEGILESLGAGMETMNQDGPEEDEDNAEDDQEDQQEEEQQLKTSRNGT